MMLKNNILLGLSLISVLGLAACAGAKVEEKFPTSYNRKVSGDNAIYDGGGDGVFGDSSIFSSKKKKSNDEGGNIGVNTYLWRASLDTISFMPITSADPFGGTIFTDWYEDPATPGERFKLNVFILDRELKADGVRVSVFKQQRRGVEWKDVKTSDDMKIQLEDSILTRARQMRAKKLGTL